MKRMFVVTLTLLVLMFMSMVGNAARVRVTCSFCGGNGTVIYEETYRDTFGEYVTEEREELCPDCDGKGYVYVNR